MISRSLAVLLGLALVLGAAGVARADEVTEAAEAFERGNEHFERGMRLRGDRRTAELEAALTDYFESLRHVRSRNVLYNTALVLEQLERWDDAFNYWSEYLAVTGLSAEETADGTTHRDAVRPRVAVLAVTSSPTGAEIWIDRRDLAARGHAPVELAVAAGDHTVYFVLDGYVEATATTTATVGASAAVTATLTPEPVQVQVLAPDGRLSLDGVEIAAGASIPVPPGRHVLRLEVEGRPGVERRFEVAPGAAPMVIDLTSAVGSPVVTTNDPTVHVSSDRASRLDVDGLPRATGEELDLTLTPGEHELTVAPTGAPTTSVRRRFDAGERLTLRVSSSPTSSGLNAARGTLGLFATLSVLTAAGLSIGAGFAADHYRDDSTQANFDTVNALNLGADITWGASLALGISAIVVLAIDDAATTATFEEAAE